MVKLIRLFMVVDKPDVYIVNRDAVEYTSIPLLYISEYIPVV